jgi:glycine cleavage system aminomethyltransferase T/glycine/D-amino acid oxidase-like deaminating enzyme
VDQARIVVIGGGIVGVSVAYHVALAGERDVLLVEKAQLTAGSTCQAMGLVTAFNPSSTMMAYRRYSIELYRSLGAFDAVGSLRIASTRDQLRELQRTLSRTRAIGLEADLVSAQEARRLIPALAPDDLYGAVWLPADGHLDPHTATHALAAAARTAGVRIRTGVRVTGIELSDRREVRRLLTTDGPIDAEIVVNAAGIWAPQVSAMVGGWIPSTPVDHQHAALRAVAGSELPRDMPTFRDPDRLVYGRSEAGGMLVGGYEAEPPARWIDGVPWEHAATSLPPDYERFAPLLGGAALRFPFLADAEIAQLVCHPDAMTPDANPLLGPLPGVRGFWVAAGLSLNGFGGAGGIGRTMAAWITTGEPDLDVVAYRAWRFTDTYRDPGFAAALAREAYSYYYRLRYPFDVDEAGRPRRLSALHGRLQEAGAVFGVKAGFERADYHEPGRAWRRAGPDQRSWGWTRPPFLDRLIVEGRAVRERVGLIDLSSFGKIAVEGPGALPLLQRVAANDVDRPVGSLVYTTFLSLGGGMLADVTVTRLGEDRFRVVTGAGYVAGDIGWLRLNLADDDQPVTIRDVSDKLACLGLWGPRARDVLGAVTDGPVDDAALPLRQARTIRIGAAPVLAARISYAGELGWELYTSREWAVQVWDALIAAGGEHGIEPFGYRALDALRLEKGYRYYGTDLTALETPDDASLGAFVRVSKGPFVGREAVLARRAAPPRHRLRTVVIGDADYLPLYGGEAVRLGGEIAGRLRSVAYGPTVMRTVGTVYLPPDVPEGAAVEVDVFDERAAGTVAADVLVDPTGERMRA